MVVSRNIDVKVSDVDAVLDIIRNITKHRIFKRDFFACSMAVLLPVT